MRNLKRGPLYHAGAWRIPFKKEQQALQRQFAPQENCASVLPWQVLNSGQNVAALVLNEQGLKRQVSIVIELARHRHEIAVEVVLETGQCHDIFGNSVQNLHPGRKLGR